ncbi:MAG: hypothetical protein BroJett024_24770 [Alphaproteobacteria bacterium]|nr:MAG: hypothetical protein BroJett024_24770 [Alphaproteobacteria bacterium]
MAAALAAAKEVSGAAAPSPLPADLADAGLGVTGLEVADLGAAALAGGAFGAGFAAATGFTGVFAGAFAGARPAGALPAGRRADALAADFDAGLAVDFDAVLDALALPADLDAAFADLPAINSLLRRARAVPGHLSGYRLEYRVPAAVPADRPPAAGETADSRPGLLSAVP